jgi:Flp pilus assembly pilin Flp
LPIAKSQALAPRRRRNMELLRRVWMEDDGQDLAEYALLLTLILLITAGVISGLGNEISNVFSDVKNKL